MRYTLLIYQSTEARNSRSQEDEDVYMNATGDIIAERSTTGEWAGREES